MWKNLQKLILFFLWMVKVRFSVTITSSILCARIPGLSPIQRQLCSESPDAMVALGAGHLLGANECQYQFKGHRWNCTQVWQRDVFGHVMFVGSREAAFTYAIASAGAVHAITAACAKGNISLCGCDSMQRNSHKNFNNNNNQQQQQQQQLYKKRQNLHSLSQQYEHYYHQHHQRLQLYYSNDDSPDNSNHNIMSGSSGSTSTNINSISSSSNSKSNSNNNNSSSSTSSSRSSSSSSSHNSNSYINQPWKWGGCSPDIYFGMKFARKFLDAREIEGDTRSLMNLHNNRAGRKIVKNLLRTECKCHGVSGSCAMKTCWKSLPPFRVIGDALMKKYNRAKLVHAVQNQNSGLTLILSKKSKMIRNVKKLLRPKRMELVYIQSSPNYCERDPILGSLGTFGRYCNRTASDIEGCDLLCCGRGYNTHQINKTWQCQCKFHWCCQVQCEICNEHLEEYTCK